MIATLIGPNFRASETAGEDAICPAIIRFPYGYSPFSRHPRGLGSELNLRERPTAEAQSTQKFRRESITLRRTAGRVTVNSHSDALDAAANRGRQDHGCANAGLRIHFNPPTEFFRATAHAVKSMAVIRVRFFKTMTIVAQLQDDRAVLDP